MQYHVGHAFGEASQAAARCRETLATSLWGAACFIAC